VCINLIVPGPLHVVDHTRPSLIYIPSLLVPTKKILNFAQQKFLPKYPLKKVDLTSYTTQLLCAVRTNNILMVSNLATGVKVSEKSTPNIHAYPLTTSLALYMFTNHQSLT